MLQGLSNQFSEIIKEYYLTRRILCQKGNLMKPYQSIYSIFKSTL